MILAVQMIETRKKKGGDGGEAATILKSVDEKEAKYKTALLDARTAGYELIEKEQKKAVAAREQKLADVKAETSASFEENRIALEKESAEARGSIDMDAAKIADKITASILKG